MCEFILQFMKQVGDVHFMHALWLVLLRTPRVRLPALTTLNLIFMKDVSAYKASAEEVTYQIQKVKRKVTSKTSKILGRSTPDLDYSPI